MRKPYQKTFMKHHYSLKSHNITPTETLLKVIWFNPPFSQNVKINIGENVFKFSQASLSKAPQIE